MARNDPRKVASSAADEQHAPAEAKTPVVVQLPGNSLIELITLQWRRERPDLDLFDFLLAICFMRLGTLIDRHFANMCQRRHGISGSDMRVLLALRRGGHPYVKRPTDLFRALLVTSGAMTKKIDRLAALDMVERLPDPGNGAGFLIRLTKKGVKAAEDAAEQVAQDSAIATAMRQFSPAEKEAGKQFCVRTLAVMEQAGVADAATGEEADEPSSPAPKAKRGRPARR